MEPARGAGVDLALHGVTKAFGGFVAVNQVSLEVTRGQRCALLGPNGAGKTTLLNLINGRLSCTAGSILIRGHDVTRRSAAARSRYGVGRSFQRTNIFPGLSLLANVRLGLMAGQGLATWNPWRAIAADTALNDAALRLLGRVNLKRDPDERADALSYGEQRQLELAITLATEPDIVLLDEPTAGMSPSETAAIIELLVELLEGRTVVIVEHDLSVVDRIAERIVVLERGRVIADGAPAEVKADPAVQRAYLKGAQHA
ncbi:MAG TPA: ABC transporter ATP-binding protein [Burkholderiaceae bacterium]|nr:ABC transporter ATP-binding protein [Burkholderiaceae bacterium]